VLEIPYAKYLDCGADMFAEVGHRRDNYHIGSCMVMRMLVPSSS
jgi:hypothetical protein